MRTEAAFAQTFYRHLFALEPELQALFPENIKRQGEMLTHMIEGVVYALSRPVNLALGLQALGRQHAGYGVTDHHYTIVRRTLLETVEEILGDKCTIAVESAWETVVDSILRLMSGRSAPGHGR